jgi:undecaprenyl phosphate N,N'-diacetylbacillosamine 1-phosphate transferase
LIITIFLALSKNFKPFFIQARPGKSGEIFYLIKFKTMTDRKDRNGIKLPDIDRLTRIGSLIRSISLDELPQLVNVLKGDMSFVGPRPLLIEYLNLYNKEQARRHEVRPGLTGWAQVNGRNTLIWQERFKLDVWYVDNISFKLDMKILWLTFLKVLKREGINSPDSATMKPFAGNDN